MQRVVVTHLKHKWTATHCVTCVDNFMFYILSERWDSNAWLFKLLNMDGYTPFALKWNIYTYKYCHMPTHSPHIFYLIWYHWPDRGSLQSWKNCLKWSIRRRRHWVLGPGKIASKDMWSSPVQEHDWGRTLGPQFCFLLRIIVQIYRNIKKTGCD